MRRARILRWRRRFHMILDGGETTPLANAIEAALVGLIVLSVCSVVLETVPALAQRYDRLFLAIEIVSFAIFTLEYALRLWSAPDAAPYAHMKPFDARLKYAATWPALVDLAAIAPGYLSLVLNSDIRILLMLRLLRFFKLARYSPGMRSLVAALHAERKALMATGVVVFGVVLVMASAMHIAEHNAQPDKFGSIPESMWWAIVTVTTIGYGDVVPITVAGKLIASVAALMGFMLLALPVGIIATAFSEEIHKREFVVTWSMLARVPLFRMLDASEIAEIMHYLRAQTVPAGAIIVRRGELARSMYFIAEGEVEIDFHNAPTRIGEGHFFGELAVLRRTRRSASVRALVPTKLLVLGAADLQTLMSRNAAIAQRIGAVAESRAELAKAAPQDMIPEELAEPDEIIRPQPG
ncbi:MAG: ion transporter [Hyphomicrobiales bacterium]|nr:ion transporter [Hyphomicrobiales bacterium]